MRKIDRVPMPVQDAAARSANFTEVALGYGEAEARLEAQRCLQCKKPKCVEGCPVGVQIPEFIKAVVMGQDDRAIDIIAKTNALPGVCGRVCPQEEQCEKVCVLAAKGKSVAIGNLERYAADGRMRRGDAAPPPAPRIGKRAAVVGAGPAGRTCAGSLAALGWEVTVYEAFHAPGGVLIYGIPEFRLPKALVRAEVAALEAAGVRFEFNVVVGRTLSVEELLAHNDAVFLGTGAGLPSFMGIPGEDLGGVFSANEYLTRINLMGAFREEAHTPIKRAARVCVVGGGNVAMDAARCAKRLGAEVTVVYRRTMAEMPARRDEVHHAQEEGVRFELLKSPVAIQGADGWTSGLTCVRMELGAPDASGRRRPVAVEGSEETIPCDAVIMAIGTTPNPLIAQTTPGLETNKWGCIVVRGEDMDTMKDGVWAGGDAVTGAATVILAMGAGRSAARSIHERCAAIE